jgi:hypothetical protein
MSWLAFLHSPLIWDKSRDSFGRKISPSKPTAEKSGLAKRSAVKDARVDMFISKFENAIANNKRIYIPVKLKKVKRRCKKKW